MGVSSVIGFEEWSALQAPFWSTKRLAGCPFEYDIKPYVELGADVFWVRQSGFSLENRTDAASKISAVCQILKGRLAIDINGKTHVYEPDKQDIFLLSNAYDVHAEFRDLELFFFPVSHSPDLDDYNAIFDIVSGMLQDFNFSFLDIYRAINLYHGLGPLRSVMHDRQSGSVELYVQALMLSNFSRGNFKLKGISSAIGTSVSTLSRMDIAGRRVSEWANTYKINTWKTLRDKTDLNEIANLLGYSSAEKFRAFLSRHT